MAQSENLMEIVSETKSGLTAVEQQTEVSRKKGTIWETILKADQETLERLLHDNPKIINARGPVGECPIHMLFLFGSETHLNMARYLIKRFPQIIVQIYNKPEYYGETILHIAIIKRNATMIEWLLGDENNEPFREQQLKATATGNFFKVGRPCYYGETPLAFACCTNQWNIVEILLKYGASVDTTDSNGNTVLHLLVIHNLPEMYTKFKARWLEEQAKMDLNASNNNQFEEEKHMIPIWQRVNRDGFTPLSLAAQLGQSEMFSFLIDERKIIQWCYGPVSCVLYPLDQLDIEFKNEGENRPISALELIVQNAHVELIIHPRVIDLVNKKWNCFAQRIFFQQFMATLFYLIIFLITTILDHSRLENFEGKDDELIEANVDYPSPIREFIYTIGDLIVIIGAGWKCKTTADEIFTLGFHTYIQTMSGSFVEDSLACAFSLCIIVVNIFRLLDIPSYTSLLAAASILGWSYMLSFVLAFRFTGPFVVMIYKMLLNDVLRFCIIYGVFLIGFSQAFFVVFDDSGFSGFLTSVQQCFFGMLGDFDVENYIGNVRFALLVAYVIIVTILLLNLLIAMMGDTYGNVIESATQIWHLQRARIVFRIEKKMSKEERNMELNRYWTVVNDERYLQVEVIDNNCFRDKDKNIDES